MSPVVVDDLIFISGAYYKIGSVLLRVKPDGKSVEEVWRGAALELALDDSDLSGRLSLRFQRAQ